MKAYDQLTKVGVKRRLAKVVERALLDYEIEVEKIKFLEEATNFFYKVTTKNGDCFAAKVVMDDWLKIEDNRIEAFLLEHVKATTDIEVPVLMKNINKEPVTVVSSELTPEPKRVLVYEWFEGTDIDGNETDERFFEVGKLTAKLHTALEGVDLPKGIKAKKWDEVFYFRGETAVYKEEKYQEFLSEEYHQVMDLMIEHLNTELPKFYEKHDAFIIHGDLNPWNIKTNDERLIVFDFEDNLLGTPIQDIAIMLFYYWHDDKFDFEKVKSSFLKGYSSVRKVPDFDEYELELLMTARRVNFLNYILQVSENPKAYIERNLPHVKAFASKFNIL